MKKDDKKINTYIFKYRMGYIFLMALVFFIIPIIPTWLYYKFTGITPNIPLGEDEMDLAIVTFFIVLFGWSALHELIHGIAYQVNGAKRENITYGVALEKGIFYCKCGEFVDKKNIIVSLLSPFVIIGVITLIIGWLINSMLLIGLSIFNISGAAGDLVMFGFFIKQDKDLRFKELGDSTTFCLKTKDDLSKKKFLSVKLDKVVTDDKEIEEEKSKKITITKGSWIFLIFVLIVSLIDILLYIFL